jgi:ketosteroid isomerase-like protein
MSREDNLRKAKEGYAAFARGDSAEATEHLADDVEWIVPGASAVSGTHQGKEEVLALWSRVGERGLQVEPEYWFADDERVCVLSHATFDDGEMDVADLLTFREGKVVKFQSAQDTALLERLFPR